MMVAVQMWKSPKCMTAFFGVSVIVWNILFVYNFKVIQGFQRWKVIDIMRLMRIVEYMLCFVKSILVAVFGQS